MATVEWYGIPENASITVEFEVEARKRHYWRSCIA